MANYLPTREADLLGWSNNFATKLVGGPADYGITQADATNYQALQTAFAMTYAAATNPNTRNKPSIAAKNTAKQSMIEATRSLVQIIQYGPEITNMKREELDIPIRDNEPTPIGLPTEMPRLSVTRVTGAVLELEILNQENQRRKPAGVRTAWIYTYVGPAPSPDLKLWRFEGGSTRSNPTIEFPESVTAGTEVWITALWVNPTDQPGPACAPVKAHINFDGLNQAA